APELGPAAGHDARAVVHRDPGVSRVPGPDGAGPSFRAGSVPGLVHRCAYGVHDPRADPGSVLPERGPECGGAALAPLAVPPVPDGRDLPGDRAAAAAVAVRGARGATCRGRAGGPRRTLVELLGGSRRDRISRQRCSTAWTPSGRLQVYTIAAAQVAELSATQRLMLVNVGLALVILGFTAWIAVALVRRNMRQRVEAERLAAMGTATARILHQIKNPLQTILLHAEMLEDSRMAADPVSRQEICQAIVTEATRMTELLAD